MSMLAILLIYCGINICNGQLLSAYEQAYGPWKIQLTRSIFGKRWYLDQLSPREDTTRSKRGGQRKNSDLQLLFPPIVSERIKAGRDTTTVSKIVKSIPCILILEKNGKFIIHVDDDSCFKTKSQHVTINGTESPVQLQSSSTDGNGFNPQSSISPNTENESHETATLHSPLKGEWYLTPNPYCVTDRHYDTLTLIAEPRIRRAHCSEGMITEIARIELRCKLWGRYGVGAVRNKLGLRHGREMGRISHGTVLVIREYENANSVNGDTKKSSRREVIASFSGRGVLVENDLCEQNIDQDEDVEQYTSELDFEDLESEF